MAKEDVTNTNDSPAEKNVVSASFRKNKRKKITFSALSHFWWILAGGLICILVIGATYTFTLSLSAIKVGDYSINRREYKRLTAEARQQGITKGTATSELKKALAARTAADKLGVTYPTDRSALTRQAQVNKKVTTPSVSDYERYTAYPSLITRYVTLGVKGGYEVGYVNFPFARFIYGFAGEDKGDPKLYRNSEALHADIKYAKQQAESYRQAYINKEKTINDMVQAVREDSRLTYGQASNQSDVFILEQNGTKDPLYASGNVITSTLLQEIQKAPVGQPTAILGELWDNDESLSIPEIKHGNFMDVAYYFIVVRQKVTARPDLQAQYNKLAAEYGK